MTDKTITIRIPESLYERMQETAEASDRSLERVMVESLDVLFRAGIDALNTEKLLEALPNYTDEQLWAAVKGRLPWSQSLRLRELNGKSKQGNITETETAELDNLVELVDRDMLLRSEALLLLKERGHNIDAYFKIGA